MNAIKINFYQLTPENETLPVFRRLLQVDEGVNDNETLLKVPADDSYERFAILSHFPSSEGTGLYSSHQARFDRLPRLTRLKLLDDGLCDHFRRRGCLVIRKKFCFEVYDQESTVSCRMKGLRLDRGLSFHLDFVFKRDRPVYGYFITLKIRRSFAAGLNDPTLQRISTGHRVFYEKAPGIEGSGILTKVNGDSATVNCNSEEITLKLADIVVPAQHELVRQYLAGNGAAPQAYAELLEDEQIAALRRTGGGKKRRDAVKAQSELVMTWLIRNSEYGRIRFNWPFSDRRISMVTTPHTILPTEEC